MITIYKYVTIYSFLRYLWRNLRTQVVCGCMLLNKLYLSVQGRLFSMEIFCLFSFKGVISIYIFGWANINLFIMEATSSQAVSFNFVPLALTPANFPKRRPSQSFTSLTTINFSFSDQFGFLFTVSMLKAT